MNLRQTVTDVFRLFERGGADEQASPESQRLQQFWESLVKQARPWSTDEWREAWAAYEGDFRDPKRVNLWRMGVKTQGAYLDEQPAHLPVKASAGFADDERATGRAEAEEGVYQYIYEEMGFHSAIARARETADVQNIAAVAHCVDMRRMLPDLKCLEMEQIAIDPDCNGILRDAGWVAYWEHVAPETLKRDHPDLDLDRLRKTAVYGPKQAQPEKRRLRDGETESARVRKRCRVWRVYARNEYALYDQEPGQGNEDEAGPHWERFRDRFGMREPRRYVEFVEGYDRLLADEDAWPKAQALDWDQWPIHLLVYDRAKDEVAPPTDWRHEKKLMEYHEQAVLKTRQKHSLSANTKIGGNAGITRSAKEIRRLLESDNVEYLPDAFDANGRQTFGTLHFEQVNGEDLAWIEALERLHEQVRGTPRLKQGGESDYNTATEAEIASESSTSLTEVRLRAFEEFQRSICDQTIAMARILVPQTSEVEVSPETREALIGERAARDLALATGRRPMMQEQPQFPMVNLDPLAGGVDVQREPLRVPSAVLDAWLNVEGAELVRLGADAMIGPEKARWWDENLPLELARRSTQVTVERGSTQRRTRLQKVAMFAEVYQRQIAPLIERIAAMDPLLAIEKEREAAEKVLQLMDLDEFETLLPDMERLAAVMQQIQAQAAEQDAAEAEAEEADSAPV